MVREALLGLLARVISRGDQRGVGQSAKIFLVLFAPLRGGALVLILALGLAFVPTSIEALRERRSLDVSAKGKWSRAIRAGTLVAVVSVLVRPEPLVYMRLVRSGRRVKMRRRCSLLCHARRL